VTAFQLVYEGGALPARARPNNATAVIRYNQGETNLLAALGLIDQISVAAR
jgi:hypothetical protein